MKVEDLNYTIPTEPINAANFDLEEWRRNNPMDYIKAIYLLLSSPKKLNSTLSKDEVRNITFSAIYKITRLHIPDTLYKFYSLTTDSTLNNKKFTTLQNKQLYMSNIDAFNDPFDGKAFFYNRKKLSNITIGQRNIEELMSLLTKNIVASSLTKNDPSILPMWAHYSNNHNGFCASYNMKTPENIDLISCTFPIQYATERIDISSVVSEYFNNLIRDINNVTFTSQNKFVLNDLSLIYTTQLLHNIKQKNWDYEKEFRCSQTNLESNSSYITAAPSAIYVGVNCDKENQNKLLSIAQSLSIPIYKMEFNNLSTNYTMDAKPLTQSI